MTTQTVWGSDTSMHIKKNSLDYITNCIYKPDRWLYYIVPTDEEKVAYYKGIVPEKLELYDGEFGTYDCPGFFTGLKCSINISHI